jgi:endonuclease/exonuclease/phosphatase (EEP) superfamily protein YafD
MSRVPKQVQQGLAYFGLVGILAITALAIGSSRFGWHMNWELFSHFQVQYLFVSLVFLGLLCWSRRWRIVLIGLVCIGFLASSIVPWYVPPAWGNRQGDRDLRLLVSNVYVRNSNYEQVLSLVRQEQPDVAVFVEVSSEWGQQLDRLTDQLPYVVGRANPYNLGNAVYSRQPLQNVDIRIPTVKWNSVIAGELEINGQTVSLIAVHPPVPVRPDLFPIRNQHLDNLLNQVRSLKTPVIVAGDFNLTMWSPYYKRLVNGGDLRNARQGFGILPTWTSPHPLLNKLPGLAQALSIPIDHVLTSAGIEIVNLRVGPDVGSDHRPLIVDLRVPRPAR